MSPRLAATAAYSPPAVRSSLAPIPARRPAAAPRLRCVAAATGAPAGKEERRVADPASTPHQSTATVPDMPSTVAPSGGSKTQPADDQFNWQQQWYPLAPVSYLDRAKPTPYTVLGRRLVVWYHAPSQQWRALEDRWPHRLAPLSEGRIEPASGNLQCSYHGWQFGGDGRCASIPQADSPQQEATACGSQRSCVAAFPVRQEQGMLWVWMEAGPGAAAASQLRPLPLPAELLSSGGDGATPAGSLLGGWYQRELPLSAEYLLENLLDPSHIHFAHSGVIGSPSRAGSIPLHLEGPLTSQGGFQLHMDRQWQGRAGRQGGRGQQQAREIPGLVDLGEAAPAGGSGSVPAVTRFVPPGLVWLEFPAGGTRFSMLFYAVPVSPGTSRVFTAYSATGLPPVLQSALRSDALAPLLHAFQFLADLGAHQVIDGDAVHIHQQERTVRQEGRRSYFMPAAADRGVMLLHRWLDEYAGGGPQYFPGPGAASSGMGAAASKPLSRQEVLDRYEQHTKHCPSCRQALSSVRSLRQALQLGSASSFAAAFVTAVAQALAPGPRLVLAPPGARLSLPLVLGVAGLLAGGAQQALGRLERQFVFVDYVHADRK